jgi:hypothetical protein
MHISLSHYSDTSISHRNTKSIRTIVTMRGVSGEAAAPDPERRRMSGREEGAEADPRGGPTTRSVVVEEGAGRTGGSSQKPLLT